MRNVYKWFDDESPKTFLFIHAKNENIAESVQFHLYKELSRKDYGEFGVLYVDEISSEQDNYSVYMDSRDAPVLIVHGFEKSSPDSWGSELLKNLVNVREADLLRTILVSEHPFNDFMAKATAGTQSRLLFNTQIVNI